MAITFVMEIKEIKQLKKASLDNEYTIRLGTEDNQLMTLSAIPSDSLVRVTFEQDENQS